MTAAVVLIGALLGTSASVAAQAGYWWVALAVPGVPALLLLALAAPSIYERWKYGNQPPPWAKPLFREGARD